MSKKSENRAPNKSASRSTRITNKTIIWYIYDDVWLMIVSVKVGLRSWPPRIRSQLQLCEFDYLTTTWTAQINRLILIKSIAYIVYCFIHQHSCFIVRFIPLLWQSQRLSRGKGIGTADQPMWIHFLLNLSRSVA